MNDDNTVDVQINGLMGVLIVLAVITAALGFFVLKIDPYLQSLFPLESWPTSAKVLHYLSPWVVFSTVMTMLVVMAALIARHPK